MTKLALLTLLGSSAWLLGSALYIEAKAALAQHLLQEAWHAQKQGAQPTPPWPWADTWPVARIQASRTEMDHIVLANASGRNLAFGPTLVYGNPEQQRGHTVISAHRDTHFERLGELIVGDELQLESKQGIARYQVTHTEIMDVSKAQLSVHPEADLLTLVTCYPFDAIQPNTTQRYLVHASLVENVRL